MKQLQKRNGRVSEVLELIAAIQMEWSLGDSNP